MSSSLPFTFSSSNRPPPVHFSRWSAADKQRLANSSPTLFLPAASRPSAFTTQLRRPRASSASLSDDEGWNLADKLSQELERSQQLRDDDREDSDARIEHLESRVAKLQKQLSLVLAERNEQAPASSKPLTASSKAKTNASQNVIGLRRLPAILSTDECAYLIGLSSGQFSRSRVNAKRTSTHFDLDSWDVRNDSVVAGVRWRVQRTIGGDNWSAVEMSVVRYEPGQFFKPHFDSGLNGKRWRSSMVVYLNDVAEGGETHFTKLDVRVKPKRGDAITWNNHSADFTDPYPEARHQGLPPRSGFKYIIACFAGF